MKGYLAKIATTIPLLGLCACLDYGNSPDPHESYNQVQQIRQTTNPQLFQSSSSLSVSSSSVQVRRTIKEDELPQASAPVVIQSSSSVRTQAQTTLADVCDEGVAVLLSNGNYSTLAAACSDYKTLLTYVGLNSNEIKACMEYEGCTTGTTNYTTNTVTTITTEEDIYVQECKETLTCKTGNCRSCIDNIRNATSKSGSYFSSNTCSRIKNECFGSYY